MEELFALVRRIPYGRCAGYGALGRALSRPVSGLVVGRWMAVCPPDLPWWRVVAKDGSMPVWNRSPHLGHEQAELLAAEGVEVVDGKVSEPFFIDPHEI
jgi:methylated-DNA-protein-cysteine methyltransferase-like protein